MALSQNHDVSIVHDYLTQIGGAERLVLSMLRAFPGAPVYTSLYEPDTTFPEFRQVDVRPIKALNLIGPLRRNHRLGLPVYAPAFRRLQVPGEVVLCSSTGWAHHVRTAGQKVVYCNTPARWLYQTDTYLGDRRGLYRAGLALLGPRLRRQDKIAARGADRYIASSTAVRNRISATYGIDSEIIAPPPSLKPSGAARPLDLEPGYLLVVSRLLSYKNVDMAITAAVRSGRRLVIVGEGPDRRRLEQLAGETVRFLGSVDDDELRWLYRNCRAVLSLSYEDFGLVPVEANSFGIPVVALKWGGFLDTVQDGVTGIFCQDTDPANIVAALDRLDATEWDRAVLTEWAGQFSEERFIEQLRAVVARTVAGETLTGEPSAPRGWDN